MCKLGNIKSVHEDISIKLFDSTLVHLLPKDLSDAFTNKEKAALIFRAIKGYKIIYLTDDNEPVAYCFLKKDYLKRYPFMNTNDWLINPYFTFEKYRGKGFATFLIDYALSLANSNVYALVKTDNFASIQVLEKCGLKIIGYSGKKIWSHSVSRIGGEIAIYRYCKHK